MSSSWRAGAGEAWASIQSSEPGTRRRKLAGYLKAANDMRQSYQQYYIGTRSSANSDYDDSADEGMPGAFPDAGIVKSGKEEMVIFPTYAMRHIKGVEPAKERNPAEDVDSGNEAEYWAQEWTRIEEDHAVVDVDVRGWIYSPHVGQMTRKNRILMGLARRLSGIPAPPSQPEAQSSIPMRSRHEQEAIEREAENIMDLGEEEAHAAAEGRYTEDSSTAGPASRSTSRDSRWSTENMPGFIQRRSALWTQQPPPNMTPEELAAANLNLTSRLRAFMALPAANVPVTVFFYNEETSQSRTTYTNDAGHFYVRAALDFVPTHTRVLASEGLATVQDVKVVESGGVSLISDIDDTIKHSAITSGAREIFRNTFVAEFDSMVVEGVKEWYRKLNDMGVQIHYVSNSPWQLYPFLRSYFKTAGLPHGSFHLKQYSGMLQGIFEPVAERKKGTLTRIMSDFPNRKFILVGDSGEADLEVYTDVVLANPGRILGVFIRDVTSPVEDAFFSKSVKEDGGKDNAGDNNQKKPNGNDADQNLIDLSDMPESPAADSLRRNLSRSPPVPPPPRRIDSSASSSSPNAKPRLPPEKPTKPSELRGQPRVPSDGRPPIPPKPRPQTRVSEEHASGVLPNIQNAASSVYNSLPAVSSLLPSAVTNGISSGNNNSREEENRRGSAPPTSGNVPFPPPPRRTGPPKASTWTPSAGDARPTTGTRHENVSRSASPARQPVQTNTAAYKRLEMWKRRWEKAEEIMRAHGVVLVMWRVGTDVMKGSEALVEKTLREMEEHNKELGGDRSSSKNKHRPHHHHHHGGDSLI